MKKVAVILSGCGFLDGAEIRESVLTLLALDTQGAHYQIFSLDKEQHHVVDHLSSNEVAGESRNILQESARIARGDIHCLSTLNVSDFDALIIPGGFGVAKNLCTFALAGSAATIDEEIKNTVQAFKAADKPIGAICIAPAMIALALGEINPLLTIGNDAGVAGELKKLGATHQECDTASSVVDLTNKIITTPAYMDGNAKLSDVYQGISSLVSETLSLA